MVEAWIVGRLGDVVETRFFRSYMAALRWLQRNLQEGEQGFLLPHYCKSRGECNCAEWLPDFRPAVDRKG